MYRAITVNLRCFSYLRTAARGTRLPSRTEPDEHVSGNVMYRVIGPFAVGAWLGNGGHFRVKGLEPRDYGVTWGNRRGLDVERVRARFGGGTVVMTEKRV